MGTKKGKKRDRRELKRQSKEFVYEYEEHKKITESLTYTPTDNGPLFGLPAVKCLNDKQKDMVRAIKDKEISIISGPAGTGKTYTALLTALNIIKNSETLNRVVLVKSVTVVDGENIGFLPGTMEEKMEHFMISYSGNIDKMFNKKGKYKDLVASGVVEIQPLAYVRGVNIDNAVVIIDELQNISDDLFKTIITRIGNNSKYVFLGDPEQNDKRHKHEGCMNRVLAIFEDHPLVGVVKFEDRDCVRNAIIPELLDVLRQNGI